MILNKCLYLLSPGSLVLRTILPRARYLHEVRHVFDKSMFYVLLDPQLDKKAILLYKIKGKIMDLYAINVPASFKGRGIARLLTESAFTYAIVNNYYLYLTCSYTQKYYLANKSRELKKRIVGPKEILNLPVSLDSDTFEEVPDPEDKMSGDKK